MSAKYRIVLTCWDYNGLVPHAECISDFFESYNSAQDALRNAVADEINSLCEGLRGSNVEGSEHSPHDFVVKYWDGRSYKELTAYDIYDVIDLSFDDKTNSCYLYREFLLRGNEGTGFYVTKDDDRLAKCIDLYEALKWIDDVCLVKEFSHLIDISDISSSSYVLAALSKFENLGFDFMQRRQLIFGLKNGLSEEQLKYFANPMFSPAQMNEIREGFEYGLSEKQVAVFAQPCYSCEQMYSIRTGFVNGLSMEEIQAFADPDFSWVIMDEKRELIERSHTVRSSLEDVITAAEKDKNITHGSHISDHEMFI